MNQSVTIDLTQAQEQKLASASPLNLWQKRLTILLFIQMLLVIGLFAYHQNSRVQVNAQSLLTVGMANIDRVVIQDANNKVTLQKVAGQWQLPEQQQLPVDKQKLDDILQKLEGTKLTWPVTTTASSHERFEVSDSKFQRHIKLFQGDNKKAELWLGTSPGFKKIHLRRAGEDQVYAVELTSFEFATEAKDWLQKDLLAVKDITTIKSADYALQKTADSWNFVSANQDETTEKVDANKVAELVSGLNNLQIQEVATQAPHGETTSVTVKSAAGEFQFEFVKTENEYFVKRSDQDNYFKLSQYEFERVANVTRASLLASEAVSNNTKTDPVSG
ncbi:DUF4340 domain-containing protein [Cellvibrio sp. OA-2007]|uniref:DUF4340 domain-containing protein n=1 Tax=Cellvibrio sp. OA-2007 TaxID=529823 RepID=UPI00187C0521|nr:DUF4340 domain-containing protein [Cellvibrio sp. OA-2007]